jgi:hypothetical protein
MFEEDFVRLWDGVTGKNICKVEKAVDECALWTNGNSEALKLV